MSAWIYARVSTREQADGGFSLEAQVASCQRYCENNDFVLGEGTNVGKPGVFIDAGHSATKKHLLEQRPGSRQLLQAIKPGDHIICTTPSRLFRSLRSSENQRYDWEKIGVFVHFVDIDIRTDTANGRLVLHVMSAVAEWKSRIIGERVKEAQRWKKQGFTPERFRSEQKKKKQAVEPTDRQTLLAQAILAAKERPVITKYDGTVHAYIRVSTHFQTAESQRESIKKHLSHQGESVAGLEGSDIQWYDDSGYSAYRRSLSQRPAGRCLLAAISAGDTVIASRADRLFRSQQDLIKTTAEIAKKGARLILLDLNLQTDSHFGDMVLRLLGMIAEFESAEISRSVLAGNQAKILREGAVHPSKTPILLLNDSTEGIAFDKGPGTVVLRNLLTPEEWRQYVATINEHVQSGKMVHKKTKVTTKDRDILADINIGAIVRVTNQTFEQLLGWPAFPRRDGMGTMVKNAIKEAEAMQVKLGHSDRRQQLIDYLKTKNPLVRIHHSIMSEKDSSKVISRWYVVKREMDRLGDEKAGLMVAYGPKNLETQAELL